MIRRRHDGCLSHFRVCRVGDAAQEAVYEATRAAGCCGRCDEKFTFFTCGDREACWGDPDDDIGVEVYRLGFNFGH